jgi:type IV secretion system protein VirB9
MFCLACLGMVLPQAASAQSGTPVVSDSRIKTFVYNENDVYSLLTHYGYQSNVEFAKDERVKTVSVGDRVGWQIIPAGRRLFIKAMEENAHTNMTVVTNERAYQFDLKSSGKQPLQPDEELVYVVRFYYPEAEDYSPVPPVYSDQPPVAMPVAPVMPQAPVQPVQTVNYLYTFDGSDALAPLKIYDDGQRTTLEFGRMLQGVNALFLAPDGSWQPVPVMAEGAMLHVPVVAPQIILDQPPARITIFNEAMNPQGAQ